MLNVPGREKNKKKEIRGEITYKSRKEIEKSK